jgi:hypothetical protein
MFSYGVEFDSNFEEIEAFSKAIAGFIKKIVSYVNPIAADLVGNSKFVSQFRLGAHARARRSSLEDWF